eukprot:COSAG02_NODE_79_length_40228_cov_18.435762_11_plen_84_part_00
MSAAATAARRPRRRAVRHCAVHACPRYNNSSARVPRRPRGTPRDASVAAVPRSTQPRYSVEYARTLLLSTSIAILAYYCAVRA